MSLFTENELRRRATRATTLAKSAGILLEEKAASAKSTGQFDIFLSHTFSDRELILGAWLALEDLGHVVYVDWIHDKHLSREHVSNATAQTLRARLSSSKCVFYATTSQSSQSKWMPWELGFKDGQNQRCAILPVVKGLQTSFDGLEYLGIYPYVSQDRAEGEREEQLWINSSPTCYVSFKNWLKGRNPTER